jgi:hypothetical protein
VGKKDKKDGQKKVKRTKFIDLNRTLTELEKSDWGEPTYPSSLVRNCHAARKKPLRQFTAEDCRILIGQRISLPYVVPVALPILESNILADGDYYPGDLLLAVLTIDRDFWLANQSLWERLVLAFTDQNLRSIWQGQKEIAYLDAFERIFPKP